MHIRYDSWNFNLHISYNETCFRIVCDFITDGFVWWCWEIMFLYFWDQHVGIGINTETQTNTAIICFVFVAYRCILPKPRIRKHS